MDFCVLKIDFTVVGEERLASEDWKFVFPTLMPFDLECLACRSKTTTFRERIA